MSKLRAAHHEAGHLIAYHHADVPVIIACVYNLGDGWAGRVTPMPYGVTSDNFHAFALVALAGPIAERVFVTGMHVQRPHWLELVRACGGTDDVLGLERHAERLGITGYYSSASRDAVALVRDQWGTITEWAARLDEESHVLEPAA